MDRQLFNRESLNLEINPEKVFIIAVNDETMAIIV